MFLNVDTDKSGYISNEELQKMPLFKKYLTKDEINE